MFHKAKASCLRHNIMIKIRVKTYTTNSKTIISSTSSSSKIMSITPCKVISLDFKKEVAMTSINSIKIHHISSQDTTITNFRAKMIIMRDKGNKSQIINTQLIKPKRAQTGLKLGPASLERTARSCTAMLRSR